MSFKKSILFLGFSVTADKSGFAYNSAKILSEKFNFKIDVCGLGGLQPQHIIFLIEEILEKYDNEYIILELNTSGWRTAKLSNEAYYMAYRYIFEICHRYSRKMIILNLPRKDVDYSSDLSTDILHDLCRTFNSKILDLSKKYYKNLHFDEILKDEVHPNSYGTDLYTRDVVDFLIGFNDDYYFSVVDYFFEKKTFWLQAPNNKYYELLSFERTGCELPCYKLKTSNTLSFLVDHNNNLVNGVLSVWGPRGGKITVHSLNDDISFYAYDAYSYYNRFAVVKFKGIKSKIIMLTLSEEIPSLNLLKGNINSETREVLIAGLLCLNNRKWEIANRKVKIFLNEILV
ncbi:hypothetical protein [Acinetobacter soli]|uniref:hypothetical protein n=1 Tax=Acinetobacter soli TaxID=487316 RepID=UPI00124C72DE|nr:hypothetical protein [Acinetobacter soli]